MNRLLSLSCLSIIIALSVISSANAQSLKHQVANCAMVKQADKRLACFDALTVKLSPTAQTKVADAQPASDAIMVNKKQLFGFESKQMAMTPEQLDVTVVKIKKGPRGKSTFFLASGQVWKQINNEQYRLKADQQVFIKKGALGSFFLGQNHRNKKIRIKRIK